MVSASMEKVVENFNRHHPPGTEVWYGRGEGMERRVVAGPARLGAEGLPVAAFEGLPGEWAIWPGLVMGVCREP